MRHQSRRPHLICDNASHIASLAETRQDETTRHDNRSPPGHSFVCSAPQPRPVVSLSSTPSLPLFGQVIRTRITAPHRTCSTAPSRPPAPVNRFVTVVGFGLGFVPDRPFRTTCRAPTKQPLLCSCMLRNTAARALLLPTRSFLCALPRAESTPVCAGPLAPGGVHSQSYLQRQIPRALLASGHPTTTSRAHSCASVFPCRAESAFLGLYLGSRLPCSSRQRHNRRQSHPTPSYPPAAAAQTQKRHSSQP